jgi:hypothetical protein
LIFELEPQSNLLKDKEQMMKGNDAIELLLTNFQTSKSDFSMNDMLDEVCFQEVSKESQIFSLAKKKGLFNFLS